MLHNCKKVLTILRQNYRELHKFTPNLRAVGVKVQEAMPSRYFINKFPDFIDSNNVVIDNHLLKSEAITKAYFCASKQPCTVYDNLDGGLYVGSSGIGYMFYHMSKSLNFAEEKKKLLDKGLFIFQTCLDSMKKNRDEKPADKCGFLLGNAGVYAVAAASFNALEKHEEAELCIDHYKNVSSLCAPLSFTSFGGDELFVGRAGYICGALWLNKEFKKQVISEEITHQICSSIIESGRKYSKQHKSPCPLMYSYYNTEYLGAAHGLSSILQMLLSCDSFLAKNPIAEEDIKNSVNYLLSLQTPSGNFPCAMDEIGTNSRNEGDELIHWCHGAPGVIYLMAKAYLRWKDEKYLKSAIKCGEVTWKKGLLKKGPGICHGVAGSGYVFLLLYRLTQDQKYIHRANEFAKFMLTNEFLKQARTPDRPYSLYEGYAGTVCYLTDLLDPSSAAFPFMDIF